MKKILMLDLCSVEYLQQENPSDELIRAHNEEVSQKIEEGWQISLVLALSEKLTNTKNDVDFCSEKKRFINYADKLAYRYGADAVVELKRLPAFSNGTLLTVMVEEFIKEASITPKDEFAELGNPARIELLLFCNDELKLYEPVSKKLRMTAIQEIIGKAKEIGVDARDLVVLLICAHIYRFPAATGVFKFSPERFDPYNAVQDINAITRLSTLMARIKGGQKNICCEYMTADQGLKTLINNISVSTEYCGEGISRHYWTILDEYIFFPEAIDEELKEFYSLI